MNHYVSPHVTQSYIAQGVTHASNRTVNRVPRLSRLTGVVVCKPLESGRLIAADILVSNQSSSYALDSAQPRLRTYL
ncbi:hypothetical protein M405DRAFT_821757 [Rhizopogon salebrosus TDB-379]|nr:hypothetical protein M405DRAFT_821757 [Rhizopogon salebrosus TDB-379]